MNGFLATVAGTLAGLALLLVILGLIPTPARPRGDESLSHTWARLTRRPPGQAGRRRDLIWATSAVAGLIIAALTGWVALALLVPALVMVAPKLLGQAPVTDIPLLESLDKWVRNVATLLPEGRDVVQSIRASRSVAPPLIAEEVARLVQRINTGMAPAAALQRFADELDSAEADSVVASLMLATTRPIGATANLNAIAANLQDRLRVLRDIEAERAKPRNTSRNVTLISLLMIGALAILAPTFLAPLSHPIGQVIVLVAVVVYCGALWTMFSITVPRKRARILVRRTR